MSKLNQNPPGLLLLLVLALTFDPAQSCTTLEVKACLDGLSVFGIETSENGAVQLSNTASRSGIQAACSNQIGLARQCLRSVEISCTNDGLAKQDALGIWQYLTYLCSEEGLKGLNYLPCINQADTRQALHNCTTIFDNMKAEIDGTKIQDLLNYLLGGKALQDFCQILVSIRLCQARATAEYCSTEASIYGDRLFQTFAQKIAEFLKCPDPVLDTHCENNNCQNGGTCFEIEAETTCACEIGFNGEMCQHSTGIVCPVGWCLNQGQCRSGTCMCVNGYTGRRCEYSPDSAEQQQSKGSSVAKITQSELFIPTIVSVLVVLTIILVVLYCVKVKRKNRLVESIQPTVFSSEKGLKIPEQY